MDQAKMNLRKMISEIMDKTKDAGFAKFALYKQGYDVDEIDKELGSFGAIKATAMADEGKNWGEIASELESNKFDLAHKGYIDMELNRRFNPQAFEEMQLPPSATQKASDTELQLQADKEKAQANASNALSKVSLLEEHPALKTSVGVKGVTGGLLGGWVMPGTKAADFNAQLDALKSMLTIENLGIMKGVLSDADIKILREAATSISKDMSESDFKAELARIKNTLQRKAGGISSPPAEAANPSVGNDLSTNYRQKYGY